MVAHTFDRVAGLNAERSARAVATSRRATVRRPRRRTSGAVETLALTSHEPGSADGEDDFD